MNTQVKLKHIIFKTTEELLDYINSNNIIKNDIQCILPRQDGGYDLFFWDNRWYV